MAYRYTKNYVITPKGVRIHRKEYDYFIKQVRSVNYGLNKIRKLTAGLEKKTYRKYPQTVYNVPKNLSTNIGKFKSIEEFREQLYKNEVLRQQVLKKPRAINEDINLKITNKLIRKARRKWTKELQRLSFIDMRNKQYKENIIKSINDVFGGTRYGEQLIEAINSMTEAEFVKFFTSTPYEIIAFIYAAALMGDDDSLRIAFEDLMQYVNKATKGRL